MKKYVRVVFILIIMCSLISSPSIVAARELNLTVKTESKVKGKDIALKINTNLPKKTKFFAIITGSDEYKKEIKLKANKYGNLKKKVKNLEDGTYTIKYQSYKPKKQPRKVRKVIGKKGSNIKGEYVNKEGVIKYKETFTIGKIGNKQSFKEEAEAGAKKYEATPGTMLYTKGNVNVTGKKYYFSGDIVGLTKIDGYKAWLVKNINGYVMPIITGSVYSEGKVSDKVKVWGTLTGDGYEASKFKVDNVVGMTGSMQLVQVTINGEDKI
ncbi:hypothetical protein [Listeria sp. PSOL-1]|uniref:hypothetical protein n=1 Tax=Listeria sp. PSOL-1 TaxID=1844999 RepID=UPI0013D04CBA|nr:hypothetical protein [Listeria sp. PSOL-1]